MKNKIFKCEQSKEVGGVQIFLVVLIQKGKKKKKTIVN